VVNLEEKIYAWRPIEGLEGEFHIYSTTFDSKGLKIVLYKDIDPKKGVLLDFSGAVSSYRISKQHVSMHLLKDPIILKDEERRAIWPFLKVENSEYLKWASYQSNTVSEALEVIHYAVWTEDWTIDVLSWSKKPRVELIDINDYIKKINAISI
jgi:hypothetical protein